MLHPHKSFIYYSLNFYLRATSLYLIMMLLSTTGFSQIASIQTDRPDQTECPYIAPVHYLQAENGFLVEWQNATQTNYSCPSTLWKYGLTKTFELRLITEYGIEKINTKTQSGLVPVTLGFKVNLCKEKGLLPMISFIGHLTSADWGSKKYKTSYAAPAFRFTLQHTVSDKLSLGYNLGTEWDGETASPVYIYTLTTGLSISNKIGSYIEVYGYTQKKASADHRCDGGLTWLINPNILVDISGGVGLSRKSPEGYMTLGFSYRIKMKK